MLATVFESETLLERDVPFESAKFFESDAFFESARFFESDAFFESRALVSVRDSGFAFAPTSALPSFAVEDDFSVDFPLTRDFF
jgi:hypothetical protein